MLSYRLVKQRRLFSDVEPLKDFMVEVANTLRPDENVPICCNKMPNLWPSIYFKIVHFKHPSQFAHRLRLNFHLTEGLLLKVWVRSMSILSWNKVFSAIWLSPYNLSHHLAACPSCSLGFHHRNLFPHLNNYFNLLRLSKLLTMSSQAADSLVSAGKCHSWRKKPYLSHPR